MPTAVPMNSGSPAAAQLADDLCDYGVVAVDAMRTATCQLAADVERKLGPLSVLRDVGEFLLYQYCIVEPAMESGWIVCPPAFDRDALRARCLVGAGVHQWHSAGQPDCYVAKLKT